MAYTIVSQISEESGINEDIVKTVLDSLRDIIINNNSIGENIAVRGIFTAKAVPMLKFTPNGKQTGFITKIIPSKTLADAVQAVSLSKANMQEVEEKVIDMDEAMRKAGIAIMEIEGLN